MAEIKFTLPQALQRAMAYLQAGKLVEAATLYKAILNTENNHVEAIRMLGVIEYRRGQLHEAVRLIDQALAIKPDYAEAHNSRGNVLAALNREQEALVSFDRALAIKPEYVEALNSRGNTLATLKRHREALDAYDQALALKPDYAEVLNNRGNVLAALNREQEALASFDQALAINPEYVDALYNRGYFLSALDRHVEALASYDRALAKKPHFAEALYNRGNALVALDRHQEALGNFNRALAIKPDYAEALNNRGSALVVLNRHQAALASYHQALVIKPDYAEALHNRGSALRDMNRWQEALESYDRALAINPENVETLCSRGAALHEMNRWQEALESYERALAINPDYAKAKFGLCMAELPVLYKDELEITSRRAAYQARLRALSIDVGSSRTRVDLAKAVGSRQPFYLAYQGFNDRELQALYGSIVCRIAAERYPVAASTPLPEPDEPVRVGIVSGYFWQHANWKIPIKGWISQLDRQRFRVFGYHTGNDVDSETDVAAANCARFVQGPMSIDRWRQTILSDAPHILIYPEVGMHPVSAQLAAHRIAPVQCVSWGHPDTSGFPTLDYFLSSDLMEPADDSDHYTEQLVRLPNLSVYYEPIAAEPVAVTRADVGLRLTSTVFWCGQSLFKFLPQFDETFARIAKESGDCQFAFIQYPKGTLVTDLFRRRLERAFAAVGLRAEDHCVFLPGLDWDKFIAVIGLCDIFLDSIGWSGANTTFESLAHDLPIVTMPGPLMRGRHTMAILKMMGVTETIAESIDSYVSVAIRLARDLAWRTAVKRRLAANKHRVYRDRTCISALEEFLDRVARRAG
jgi:protein O-GlcNAc transferase